MSGVRDTLASIEGRLDDVRREHAWRAIASKLDAADEQPQRRWPWLVAPAMLALAALVVVAATRGGLPVPRTFTVDVVVATAPHDRIVERGDVKVTVLDGTATVIDARDGTLQVRVVAGTVVVDRGVDAPPVTWFAGDTHSVSRDRRFAVRVEPSRTVFGAGEHARELVERQLIELAPPVRVPEHQQSDASRDEHDAPTRPKRRARPTLRIESVSVPERSSAAELYRRAETALAAHDSQRARELLEQLLRDHPNDQRVDAARYDLALIAHAAGDQPHAVGLLDAILANGGDASVRVAAQALRDRIAR